MNMNMNMNTLQVLVESLLEEASSTNTLASDVNEIYLSFYCADENWSLVDNSIELQELVAQRQANLNPNAFADQKERAKLMAQSSLEWANQNDFSGKVKRVWWTARPNALSQAVGISVDSRKNPTDVLLQFTDNKFLGLSAKSTGGSGDIGFKNPGLGTLAKVLNTDFKSLVAKVEQKAIAELRLPATKTERKIFIRSNPEIQGKTIAVGQSILELLRNALYKKYLSMSQEDLRKHVIGEWMDADKVYPPYIKVTGHGKNSKYSATVHNPLQNEKLEALTRGNLEVVLAGSSAVGIKASGKKILKMRLKYESEKLASAIKLSGEPM